MVTLNEFTAVEEALKKVFLEEEYRDVPAWERGMIPPGIIPALASLGAKTAIATLDAYRAAHKDK